MSSPWLFFLDLTLFSLHVAVIGFNLFGWVLPKWRKAHICVIAITLFSWIILGFWFGFGYCFLTDWEWDIKRQLGETNLPGSFIAYIVNNILGMCLSDTVVEIITVGAFLPAVLLSLYFNFIKKR